MKFLLITSFLISMCCISAFAQTNETLLCPTISIYGPMSFPNPDEPITYTALVGKDAEKYDIKYVWTVSGGEILEGQGTSVIKTTWKNSKNRFVATVKIEGLPEHCDNTRSEVMHYTPAPEPIKFAEFLLPITDKSKNYKLIETLQDDPSTQLYVIFYFKKNSAQKSMDQKIQQVVNYLIGENKIGKERITKVKAYSDKKEFIQFWLIGSGVMPPVPEKLNENR